MAIVPASVGIRRDIAELIALTRFVRQRRDELAAAGSQTAEADELLERLKSGLRAVLPLRRWQVVQRLPL